MASAVTACFERVGSADAISNDEVDVQQDYFIPLEIELLQHR
jgi:hypothetical protein